MASYPWLHSPSPPTTTTTDPAPHTTPIVAPDNYFGGVLIKQGYCGGVLALAGEPIVDMRAAVLSWNFTAGSGHCEHVEVSCVSEPCGEGECVCVCVCEGEWQTMSV